MSEVDIFKALSDPTRLKILECIEKGEKCICKIIPYTGKSQPNVSQHLKVMKHAGIIDERKDGTKIMIKASNDEIFKIINQVKKIEVNL
ncbi:ArsR family transcriptional regulator [Methanosarcinales archaeon]|nr:MAG: ArsR family transcriptional regulator [Methanosarcinales archaeon]